MTEAPNGKPCCKVLLPSQLQAQGNTLFDMGKVTLVEIQSLKLIPKALSTPQQWLGTAALPPRAPLEHPPAAAPAPRFPPRPAPPQQHWSQQEPCFELCCNLLMTNMFAIPACRHSISVFNYCLHLIS